MRALCLSGGGSKGAFQVGALEHILGDLGVQYDIITGISVGALNGSYLAQYGKGDESDAIKGLVEVWNGVNDSAIFQTNYPVLPKALSMAYSVIATNSLYDSSPLNRLVDSLLDPQALVSSGKELAVGAVSLKDGEYRYWHQDSPDIVKAVQASASYPIFFKPVEIEGQEWTDGGVRNIVPMEKALSMGATEIDVITTSPVIEKFSYKSHNVIESLFSVLGILLDEVMDTDLVLGTLMAQFANVPVRMVYPTEPIGSGLDFNQDLVKLNRQKGYESAKKLNWGLTAG